mmetsp:Transcript_68679/g.191449  ORF Transcript_68679/g.191449 Transcript_68679/m.191449 type:complete len:783 (+) Transcript_68679:609-2957(+)
MKPFSPGKQEPILDEDDYHPQPALVLQPDNQAGFVERVVADIRGKDLASFERVVGIDHNFMNVAPNVKSMKHMTYGKATESEARKLERAAYLLVEDIDLRIRKDLESRSNITKLVFYLITVVIFMSMVMFQASTFTGQNQIIHQTITAGLFTSASGTMDENGAVKDVLVFSGTSEASGVLDWFETNILQSIFTANNCGDDVCSAPEEYPHFQAGSNARVFQGCKKDCGTAPTSRVIVDFFDPWKLQQAYDTVYTALQDGWDFGTGRQSARTFGATGRTPAAGWNICSRDNNEYGFYNEDGDPIRMCIFDADITIDGIPYRTAELEYGGANFGSLTSVNLYDGEWELRIAYENFTWGYQGENIPIAFPAVRGQIINFDTGSAVRTTWDPCAAARNCTCEWYRDGQYYCWEPRFYDVWSHEFEDWVEQENLGWVAEFLDMGLNYTNPSTLNTTALEDDTWDNWEPCKNAGTHTLVLLAGYYDDDDDDGSYGDDDDDGGEAAWGTNAMMYLYEEVDGTDQLLTSATVDGTTYNHMAELEQYMCPKRSYKIRVSSGADDDDGYSRVSWVLFRNFEFRVDNADDDDYRNVECDSPCMVVAYNFYKTHSKCSFYGSTGTAVNCGSVIDDDGDDDDDGTKYNYYYGRRLEESPAASEGATVGSATVGSAYGITGADGEQGEQAPARRWIAGDEASRAHFFDVVREQSLHIVAGVHLKGGPMSAEDQAEQQVARERRSGYSPSSLVHSTDKKMRRTLLSTSEPTSEPTAAAEEEEVVVWPDSTMGLIRLL